MITLYTGDTFTLKCKVRASATAPTSLAGYTITSAVKTADGFIHPAAVTIDALPSVAWFVRIEAAVTANWPGGKDENDPSGDAEWDCKVVKDGITVHSEKRPVRVIRSVTP